MGKPNEAGWLRTLADVDESIGQCLETLDRYEAAFGHVYAETAGPPEPRPDLAADPRLASPEAVWVARLDEACRAADGVASLLAEGEDLWAHWLEAYNRWKGSLDRLPGEPAEAGHAESRRDPPRRRAVGAVR